MESVDADVSTVRGVAAAGFWDEVNALVDRATSLDALRAHRLQLLAASLWRSTGRPVPIELRDDERRGAMLAMAAPGLLRRARAACDGRLMLMKGPEVACRYPDPAARYFGDLDLLSDDPRATQRALVAAGFVELESPEDWVGKHHLPPLAWPGIPLAIEVHRGPKLPGWLAAPTTEELMALAVPSATGIDGLLAPAPAAHALMLAAHGWAHRPLGRLGDLIDVAAMLTEDERAPAAELAHRWGWSRMWTTTLKSADALLRHGRATLPLRTWGRYLNQVRDLSVIEFHVIQIAGPLFAASLRELPGALGGVVAQTASPWPGETWGAKLTRSRKAVVHAFSDQADHDRQVGHNPWRR